MPVFLSDNSGFPPVELADPWGCLAFGGNLSMDQLLRAYTNGIFPWGGEPVGWYSPDPRCVVDPILAQQVLPRRLWRTFRSGRFEIRLNTAFADVIRGCAEPAPGRESTWLTPRMIAAYERLHEEGIAHSVETWRDDRLVGGLYGVALGAYFSGESMFNRERDASKVAYVALLRRLEEREFELLDCQVPSRHLFSLGAGIMSRRHFLQLLHHAIDQPREFA
jgi:leucyl/phenylalanyl-tRNA--protein transferase